MLWALYTTMPEEGMWQVVVVAEAHALTSHATAKLRGNIVLDLALSIFPLPHL